VQNLLIARGLSVPDLDLAAHYLSNINYYRLSAYLKYLQIDGDPNYNYKKGTDLEQVLHSKYLCTSCPFVEQKNAQTAYVTDGKKYKRRVGDTIAAFFKKQPSFSMSRYHAVSIANRSSQFSIRSKT
jgi:hypothetical protein